jgi:Flp pilus assembly protein TadD
MRAQQRHYRIIILWLTLAVLLLSCTPGTVTPNPLSTADAHVVAGEYTAAEAAYRAAAQAAPNDPQPALRLAVLYRRWNRPQAGLMALDEAVHLGTASDSVAALRLELLAMTEEWPLVVNQAIAHLETAPNDPTALKLLAQAHARQYQCSAATEAASRWRAADPHNPEAAKMWGVLTADPVSLCEADTHLCSVVQACSDRCDLRLGLALIRELEWPLATCTLTRAATTHPTSAETQAWLGEALARLGRTEEARQHLVAATTLAPESPLVWLLLGAHDLRQQNTEEAQAALLQAHTLDPENPAPCLALAEVKAQMGDYDEIAPWIEAAVAISPTDAEVWKAVARFYLERHLSDEHYPIRAILSAIQLDPEDGEARMLLGWFRLMEGNADSALVALDEAVALAPHLGPAHYLRGQALQATGKSEDARQAIIRASDLGYWP